jgi:methylase of polypeptide subunit release factors
MLAAEGQSRLKRAGRLMAEFGDGQEQAVHGLFSESGWQSVEIADDLTGRPRIVIAYAGH